MTYLQFNVNARNSLTSTTSNVNIYTPANAGPSSNLSVLFWLYGGSLQVGALFTFVRTGLTLLLVR